MMKCILNKNKMMMKTFLIEKVINLVKVDQTILLESNKERKKFRCLSSFNKFQAEKESKVLSVEVELKEKKVI